MSFGKSSVRLWISVAILGILVGAIAVAQVGESEVAGSIKDPSGAPVPAKVTLTNQDSGVARVFTADAEGRYRFVVPPGRYSLKVEATGFKTETVTGIVLNIGIHADQ